MCSQRITPSSRFDTCPWSIAVSYKTIHDHACEHPAKTAIVYNGISISYAAFARAIAGTISYLDTQALPEGSTVVVRINILPDCWVAVLALQALGLNTVCVKTASVVESLALGTLAGIVTSEIEAGIEPLEPGTGIPGKVIVIPHPGYSSSEFSPGLECGGRTTTGGQILYTSGTTGSYKKVLLDGSRQLARNAERAGAFRHRQADTVYHCGEFGQWTAFGYKTPLYVWHIGGTVIFEQRPEWPQHFLESTKTNAFLMPDMARQLLDALPERRTAGAEVELNLVVAGGFISNTLADQLRGRFSASLENVYGSTEVNAPPLRSVVETPEDLHWLHPSGSRVVEVVDERGDSCPVGVEGELRVHLTELDCSEYLDDPQTSQKVFRSGCFYPGDMAVRRADGRIRILGRSADVVNIGGQKRAPAPYELEIQQRLGVAAVCLFSGLNSEGEPELLIALEAEDWPDESELKKLLREFPQFGRTRVLRVRQFPRTRTGTSKVDRVALRKRLFPAPA